MLAIYKRELRSYFNSLTGWLFCAVLLAFVGVYFMVYNLMNGYTFHDGVIEVEAGASAVRLARVLAAQGLSGLEFASGIPGCIGGLIYATLMTLFVIPCIYDMMNKKEIEVLRDEDLEFEE